jgi:hypothetical protein
MKFPASLALLAVLGLCSCVSPRITKETHWDQIPAGEAADFKSGLFRAPLSQVYRSTQYLLESEGMVIARRDLVNVLLQTMPWTEPGSDAPSVLKVYFKKGKDKDTTQVTWKHYHFIRYRLVFQGGELVPETTDEIQQRRSREKRGDYTEPVERYVSLDQAYQTRLNEDWNWRLYQTLAGRIIPRQ